MKNVTRLVVISILLLFASTINSQTNPPVSVNLTIENQTVVGTDFFFDVYITRTGTNDCYLGTSDFVLTFNLANFTNPTLSKVGSAPGFCTFVPTDQSGINVLLTQAAYFGQTATEIIDDFLLINLNTPSSPSDQSSFDAQIAKIDNVSSTHCLGRFKISGISNTSGTAGLTWSTSGDYETLVYTFKNVDPWNQYLVTINAIDPPDAPLPVELNSFTAKLTRKSVELNWSTVSEINNYGFEVQRRFGNENQWKNMGFVPGSGNSNSEKKYSFIDKNLPAEGQYIYRLKQMDSDGKFEFSNEIKIDVILALIYSLDQNYPNPFNPSTKITYTIPEDGKVKISIFNSLGEQIDVLVNEFQTSGIYKINYNANNLNSGIYLYKIEVNDFSAIKKMLLLK